MAISRRYEQYLRHFGTTISLADLSSGSMSDAIALRHDVDHDIDVALEMARFEYDRDIKATYFVLHTAPYWKDPYLVEKLLQLQDYHHEVGLHVNVLTEWMRGDVDAPGEHLADVLASLRNSGVRVTGMSAHGDASCYRDSFINYWCFSELRPDDPAGSEEGRTAEGPFGNGNDKQVAYPNDHKLTRADGARFPLWSLSMHQMGIKYDAWHLPVDRYFSDSGGNWTRTPDPINEDLSHRRHQVLVHPIHWLGEPRTYFFLSTARAGSKWMAQFLNEATPLTARHEFMLNHEFHEGRSSEKRTGIGFAKLAEAKEEATPLIADGWSRREEIKADYAEVNVYLEPFTEILRTYFPDSMFVMLQRDPAAIVRSLVNRGWYDNPEDSRHRRVLVDDWVTSSQFERACHYVADVFRTLRADCRHKIRLEDVSANLPALIKALEHVGIVVHPRLAARAHADVVDATQRPDFPLSRDWSAEQRRAYDQICGKEARLAGYGNLLWPGEKRVRSIARLVRRSMRRRSAFSVATSTILFDGNSVLDSSHWNLDGLIFEQSADRAPILKPDPDRSGNHRRCILGGSRWERVVEGESGWQNLPDSYLAGRLRAKPSGPGRAILFVLSYGPDGTLVHRRQLGVLSASRNDIEFACHLRADVDRFDLALYVPKDAVPEQLAIKSLELRLEPLAKDYSALD